MPEFATPIRTEPYAYVTRRQRLWWVALFMHEPACVFQIYIPNLGAGDSYCGEFNTLKELTHFIESHLSGKSVRWDI